MTRARIWLGVVLGGAVGAGPAVAAESGSLPRIAVADISELSVGMDGAGPVDTPSIVRAAIQGVADACLDPATGVFRPPPVCEHPAADAPAGVCAGVTHDEALARSATCRAGDLISSTIDLASSACRTEECVQSDAQAAGATHVLVVQGRSPELGLEIQIDLVDLSTDGVGSRRYRDYFPVGERDDAMAMSRTPAQLLAIVRGIARDLVEASVGGAFTVRSSRPKLVLSPLPRLEQAQSRLPPWRWEAWTLVSGGFALAVAGETLWILDGHPAGCSNLGPGDACDRLWDTRKIGLPLVVGGGLAAGAGLWLLLLPPHDAQIALVPTGSGATLMGTF